MKQTESLTFSAKQTNYYSAIMSKAENPSSFEEVVVTFPFVLNPDACKVGHCSPEHFCNEMRARISHTSLVHVGSSDRLVAAFGLTRRALKDPGPERAAKHKLRIPGELAMVAQKGAAFDDEEESHELRPWVVWVKLPAEVDPAFSVVWQLSLTYKKRKRSPDGDRLFAVIAASNCVRVTKRQLSCEFRLTEAQRKSVKVRLCCRVARCLTRLTRLLLEYLLQFHSPRY